MASERAKQLARARLARAGVCPDCLRARTECARCETQGVCECCPCECEMVAPTEAAREAMARYDRGAERREAAVDGADFDNNCQ